MSYLRSAFLIALVAPFVQLASASAAAQFHLDVNQDISSAPASFSVCSWLLSNLMSYHGSSPT